MIMLYGTEWRIRYQPTQKVWGMAGTVFVATREDVPKEGSSEEPAVDPAEAGATAEFLWGCPACGSRTRGKINKCRHCGSLRICKNLGPDGEEFFNTVGYTKLHDETRYGVGKQKGTSVAESVTEHSAEKSDAEAGPVDADTLFLSLIHI